MSALDSAIYIYVLLVSACLIIVVVGFSTRRILSAKAHKKLLDELSALQNKLKTSSYEPQDVAKTFSGLRIPIDHYGRSSRAQEELEGAIGSLTVEANTVAKAKTAKQAVREKVTQDAIESAANNMEKVAIRTEDAAKRAEDAANKSSQATTQRVAMEAAEKAIAMSQGRAGIPAEVALRYSIKDALEKLKESSGARKRVAVQPLTADEAESYRSIADVFFSDAPVLSVTFMALVAQLRAGTREEVIQRISNLTTTTHSKTEFESETQKFLEEVARRIEQEGLATEQGETEVSG